jgi:hypothetical protein
MMIIVNRLGEYISGAVNGKQFGVTFDQEKYDLMKTLEAKASVANTMEELKALVVEFEPLTKESYKELIQSASPYLFVNKHTNKFYLQYNKVISSKALPQVLVDKILLAVEKNITDGIDPLIKCWVRFMRNPNFTEAKAAKFAQYITAPYKNSAMAAKLMKEQGVSQEVADQICTTTQVAITLEGLLVGYKVSNEIMTKYSLDEDEDVITKSRYQKTVDPDTGIITYTEPEFAEDRLFEPACMGQSGDEFWCVGKSLKNDEINKKGHHIRVGCLHYLESWDQVDCNDNSTCVKGLHVGGLNYIHGFQSTGITHNVLIDPADIGAVVGLGYGNDGAMRVRRYFVHSSFSGVNKNIYHSSRYAAMNDEEYQKTLEEVTKKTEMSKEELNKNLEEAYSLV